MKISRPHWPLGLLGAAVAAAILAACGGGSDTATTPTIQAAGTTAYAQGAIAGFGSVIVGGVRYDDTGAAITDESGATKTASSLRLGMQVQISGTVDSTGATGTAKAIKVGNEVLGPVASIDSTASSLVVLGQTVLVNADTVFDTTLSGGLSALTVGAVIEVHGTVNTTTGQITATRIEDKSTATSYQLHGAVASLDTTAKTFKIGAALISYAGLDATAIPSDLANGLVVRVQLLRTQADGAWVATSLGNGKRKPDAAATSTHVEGAISTYTSVSSFVVNGVTVDATNATFTGGTSADLALGVCVDVTGTTANGVMTATQVVIHLPPTDVSAPGTGASAPSAGASAPSMGGGKGMGKGTRDLELHGALSAIDTTAKTFVVRATTVWYGGTVTYTNGTEATLLNGANVEVHGVLSTDRTRVEATRIAFQP